MEDGKSVLLVFHLVSTLFMAAPLYMLVIVNERARFGLPPGYNTDRYMENIIRRQPMRCYAYLAVVLVTGLLLLQSAGLGWGALISQGMVVTKVVALILLLGFLSYIHFGVQPRIETILEAVKPDGLLPEDARPRLMALRTRRKKFSALCLFLVLVSLMAGARLTLAMSLALFLIFLALSALFAWRAYRVPVPRGWF